MSITGLVPDPSQGDSILVFFFVRCVLGLGVRKHRPCRENRLGFVVDCGKCWIVFAVMKDETKCVRRLESDEEDKADGAGDTTTRRACAV